MAKRRVSRRYSFSKKRYSRRSSRTSGIMGDLVTGAVLGAGIQFAGPTINSMVPSVMGLRPMTVALLGGGVAGKAILHKGGKFADGAIILGTALAVSDLLASQGGSSSGGDGYL